jgi:hypothetical protein
MKISGQFVRAFGQHVVAARVERKLSARIRGRARTLNGFERKTYGRWEAQVEGEHAQLLAWPYGSCALPVVLAVFPR